MQSKDEEVLSYPGKLKGDPNRRSRDKYCRFHRDHSHDTTDCYDLKQQIETLIKQGNCRSLSGKREQIYPLKSNTPDEIMNIQDHLWGT